MYHTTYTVSLEGGIVGDVRIAHEGNIAVDVDIDDVITADLSDYQQECLVSALFEGHMAVYQTDSLPSDDPDVEDTEEESTRLTFTVVDISYPTTDPEYYVIHRPLTETVKGPFKSRSAASDYMDTHDLASDDLRVAIVPTSDLFVETVADYLYAKLGTYLSIERQQQDLDCPLDSTVGEACRDTIDAAAMFIRASHQAFGSDFDKSYSRHPGIPDRARDVANETLQICLCFYNS